MDNNKVRVRYIDVAKGIAIICIILGHLGNSEINRVVFTFHVPIFYFITGYFVSCKRSLKEFAANSARTLLVPYYITCVVMIILGTVKGFRAGDAGAAAVRWIFASLYAAGDSYTEPFTIPAIGAIWFLWAAFWGKCFLRLSLEYNKWVRLVMVIALFLAGYYSRAVIWAPLSIQAGTCALLFMYMGNLLRKVIPYLKQFDPEVKMFSAVAAAVIWISFIRNFQSFWLVHCDIGRGVIDIFGSVCACYIIMLISQQIDKRIPAAGGFLSFFGKYSMMVLCIHIIELNLFPWQRLMTFAANMGATESIQLIVLIIGKLVLDLSLAAVLVHIGLIRKIFGYKL